MAAMALSLGVLAFWWLVGLAFLSVFRPRLPLRTTALIAPASGMALTALLVFLPNWWGWPVRAYAAGLLAGLAALAAAVLVWRRPLVPVRRLAPVLAVLLGTLLLVGRPLFEYGFGWVSYCNEDMANYCLAAARFSDYGYNDVPSQEALDAGRDRSLYYWQLHVMGGVRSGSDLLLAATMAVTGLSAHEAFMPVILAMQLALVASAAALAYQSGRSWRAAVAAAGLVGASALTAYGTLAQLIGQVGGLALLAGAAVLLFRPVRGRPARALAGPVGALAVQFAGVLLVYPEVVPFLGVAYVLWQAAWYRRHRALPAGGPALLAASLAACAVCLQGYTFNSLVFLGVQLTCPNTGGSSTLAEMFPYFLVPSGLPGLWGLQELVGDFREPWMSLSILAGAALLAGVGAYALRQAARGVPVALVTAVMLAVGTALFARGSAFGLFKLAMFLQPFLLGCFALACRGLPGPRWARAVPVLLLAAANLAVGARYVDYSGGGRYGDVPHASEGLNARFRAAVAPLGAHKLVLDSSNTALGKFQALYTRGVDTALLSRDPFEAMYDTDGPRLLRARDDVRRGRGVLDRHGRAARGVAWFDLHDPAAPGKSNRFTYPHDGAPAGGAGAYLVGVPAEQTVFNRRQLPGGPAFLVAPLADVRNHLVYVESELGKTGYNFRGCGDRDLAFSSVEPDHYYAGGSMQGVGRHLLFHVVNPAPTFRVLLDFTATLRADRIAIPPACAVGAGRVAFPVCGHGSARVVSPPLAAQEVAGRPYVALDLGADGAPFPNGRSGLNRLWGSALPIDRRPLTAFARDISLLTEEEYRALTPPAAVGSFPDGLRDPGLEYSGLYEDGWVAEEARCTLRRPAGGAAVVVRGQLPGPEADPEAAEGNHLEVRVGGRAVAAVDLKPGPFEVRGPLGSGAGGKEVVELRFARVWRLPNAKDRRFVAALLTSVGFEPER
jgi:hypothetical protein